MREEIESERETERVTFFSKQKWKKVKNMAPLSKYIDKEREQECVRERRYTT